MSEAQAERAIQSLYEDVAARDELTDSEAAILLKWGEDQIMRLVEQALPDEVFDEACGDLGGLLRRMNRLAARRAHLILADQEKALDRIANYAARVGLTIPPARQWAFRYQPTSEDNHENVRTLIALVMGDTDAEDRHDKEA